MAVQKVQDIRKSWIIKYFYSYGIYFIFLILVIVFSLKSKQFLSVNNIINILQQSAALGIVTVGMIFVIMTAGIDISVGSTMYFASCLAGFAISKGAGLVPAVIVALFGGALIGAVNGFVISKYRVIPFIATLATMGIARGLGLIISKAQILFYGDVSKIISSTKLLGIPITVYMLVAVLLVGNFFLRRTQFGRQLYAIGNDEAGAKIIGINVERKKFFVYFICGILAGLAGLILSAQVSAVTPTFATGTEFIVISAAVLGGTSLFGGKGNVLPGALLGVIIVTVIENGLNVVNASPYVYAIIRGIIIYAAVMVDSIKNSGELR